MAQLYVPTAGTAHKHAYPDSWEHFRPLITQLYADEDKTLPEVMRTLAQVHGHHGTARQYKRRIKKWGLDKNHKEIEMCAIVHQKRQRDAIGKASAFSIRGKPITVAEVFRYFRRRGVLNPEAEAGSANATPEAIRCWTPSPGDETQPAEMDANLGCLNEWPMGSSQTDDLRMMGLSSTTETDIQLPQNFNTNQMRQLLSLSPEISTLEMPRPLLPPQTLLILEQLLFTTKAYFEGSFRNGTFVLTDRGLSHVSGVGPDEFLNYFMPLCTAAGRLIGSGAYLEGRRLLSRVFSLAKAIVLNQHPRTLEIIICAVAYFADLKLPEISTHLRSYFSDLAANLTELTPPWRQILLLIGRAQNSDIQSLLKAVRSCITNMIPKIFARLYGGGLWVNIDDVMENLDPKIAGEMLRSLLAKAEQRMAILIRAL